MKKIISLLLSMMLLVSLVGTAMADTTSITAFPGGTVTLKIDLTTGGGKTAKLGIRTNNAPVVFLGATGGEVNDVVPPQNFSDYFVLFNAKGVELSNDGTSLSGNLSSYTVGNLEAGNVGTLTFKVKEDAAVGSYTVETYVVSGSCKVSGKVTFKVTSRHPGDADGDGQVTMTDALVILQYFSGFDVRINESNADCDGDGAVTMADALRILQYFSGFDVELKSFVGFSVRTK